MTELAKLRETHAARARLDAEIRAGLVAVVDAGASFAELAAVLGVSRQAVRQLYLRAKST